MRPALLAAAASGLLAALPSAAPAASPWFGPVPLSGPQSLVSQAAMTPAGDAVVVWESSRLMADNPEVGKVEAVVAARGAPFSPPQRLASHGVRRPVTGIAPDGAVFAAWSGEGIDTSWSASGSASAGFGAPGPFAAPRNDAMAVDGHGNAVVAWTNGSAAQEPTQVLASFRPAGGSFGPAQTLGEHGRLAETPVVAVDGQGGAVVAWRGTPPGETYGGTPVEVHAALVDSTGRFASARRLSGAGTDTRTAALEIASGPRGDVAVAWQASMTPPTPYPSLLQTAAQAAIRPPGGEFAPPETLEAAPSSQHLTPVIAFDSAGQALAVWSTTAGTSVSRRPPGGPFLPERRIAGAAGSAQRAAAGFDSFGNAVVAWSAMHPDSRGRISVTTGYSIWRPGGEPSPAEMAAADAWVGGLPGRRRGGLLFDGNGRGLMVLQMRDELVAVLGYDARQLDRRPPAPISRLAVRKRGSRITARYRLSVPARVVLTLRRRSRGYRVVARRRLAGKPGANAVTVRRLRRGRYRLTLRVLDAAGRPAATRSLAFRL